MKAVKSIKAQWWKYLLATGIIVLHILPLYVLLAMSFKQMTDIGSRLAWPSYVYFDNYIKIFKKGTLWTAYFNTAVITVAVVFIEIFCGCLAAYALARNQSKFNEVIRSIVLGVMMIPALSVLVGVYSLLVQMGATNTRWGVILVSAAFGLPSSIFLYSNYIVSIPRALDEAATIDGAGTFQCFWYVILPQLKPVTVTVIILKGVGVWNDYLYPMYILQNPKLYTVVLTIKQYFSTEAVSNLNGAAAYCVLGMLPVIVLYIVLNKYFVRGSMDSAVK